MPQVKTALRIARLRGRNLELVEHRVLRRLSRLGIGYGAGRREVSEDLALVPGLLFRALAPMHCRDNMRAVSEGIEAMGRKEAAYGMAIHRKNPRRVLTALHCLLTEPRRR